MDDALFELQWERIEVALQRASRHAAQAKGIDAKHALVDTTCLSDVAHLPPPYAPEADTHNKTNGPPSGQPFDSASRAIADAALMLDHSEAALQQLANSASHASRQLFQEFYFGMSTSISNEREDLRAARSRLVQWRAACGLQPTLEILSSPVTPGRRSALQSPLQRVLQSPWRRSPCTMSRKSLGAARANVRMASAWAEFQSNKASSLDRVEAWLSSPPAAASPDSPGPFEYAMGSFVSKKDTSSASSFRSLDSISRFVIGSISNASDTRPN